MKPSMFNIPIKEGEKTLLYNTLTTSMISLNNDLYRSIFLEHIFSVKEADTLYEMGFLVEKDCDEVLEMRKLRTAVIDT